MILGFAQLPDTVPRMTSGITLALFQAFWAFA
jgi:hypothetical protein